MALDLLQLGQHLGQLEARIATLENEVDMLRSGQLGGASSAGDDGDVDRAMRAEMDDGSVEIPGLGKIGMGQILGEALKKYGGPEGLFAALSKADAPAPAAAPAANPSPQAKPT